MGCAKWNTIIVNLNYTLQGFDSLFDRCICELSLTYSHVITECYTQFVFIIQRFRYQGRYIILNLDESSAIHLSTKLSCVRRTPGGRHLEIIYSLPNRWEVTYD